MTQYVRMFYILFSGSKSSIRCNANVLYYWYVFWNMNHILFMIIRLICSTYQIFIEIVFIESIILFLVLLYGSVFSFNGKLICTKNRRYITRHEYQ